jgi:transposase
MSGNWDSRLFEGLSEHAAPVRRGGRPRLRKAERRQVELRALSLEDLVAPEHRVRQVWAFVEGLDLSALYAAVRSVEGHAGHPPADPQILMALWLYATIDGVGSAREVARLCDQHVAYQWLCGGVGMNHKTLGDFRVGHGALLERLLVDGFAALLSAGVASLERVAQDGMRVRASAGGASFRRHSTLEECQRQAEARVHALRAELAADPGAVSRREAAARTRAAEERRQRVATALAAAERLAAQRAAVARRRSERAARKAAAEAAEAVAAPESEPPDEPKPEPEPRVSTTDPEARVMKMADGGYRPAYNIQLATDAGSGLIAGVAVDAIGSDMGKLLPMSDQIEAAYGARPAAHLADGGFTKLDDIETLEKAGSAIYAPPPRPRDKARDPFAPLPTDPPEIAAWRRRMGAEEAKEIYKLRAATAECSNAQFRNRGLIRLLVRGTQKVKAVTLWHALAQNMTRIWSLQPA